MWRGLYHGPGCAARTPRRTSRLPWRGDKAAAASPSGIPVVSAPTHNPVTEVNPHAEAHRSEAPPSPPAASRPRRPAGGRGHRPRGGGRAVHGGRAVRAGRRQRGDPGRGRRSGGPAQPGVLQRVRGRHHERPGGRQRLGARERPAAGQLEGQVPLLRHRRPGRRAVPVGERRRRRSRAPEGLCQRRHRRRPHGPRAGRAGHLHRRQLVDHSARGARHAEGGRLLLPRRARRDGGRQADGEGLLQCAPHRSRLLRRLLQRRPHGVRSGHAVPRRLRRHHRRGAVPRHPRRPRRRRQGQGAPHIRFLHPVRPAAAHRPGRLHQLRRSRRRLRQPHPESRGVRL